MAFDDVFSIDNFQNDIIDSSINEDFSMNGGCNHYCGDVDDAQDCWNIITNPNFSISSCCNHYCGDVDDAQDCWNNCGDDDDDSCDCDCD